MARGRAQSDFAAKLRASYVARQAHESRLATAPKLTPEEEQEKVAEFLRRKGVTVCPPMYLEGCNDPIDTRTRAPRRR